MASFSYKTNSPSQSTSNETAEPDLRKPGGHHASCGAQLGHFGRRFSSVPWESVSLAGALAGESSSEATSGAVFVNISCGVYFPCSVLALKCWPQRFSWIRCRACIRTCWRERLARSPSLGGLKGCRYFQIFKLFSCYSACVLFQCQISYISSDQLYRV